MSSTNSSSSFKDDEWVIEATDQNNYVGAPVANGQIGILPWCEPFSIRHIILNHVFEFGPNGDVFRVVKAINPFDLIVRIDGTSVNNENISHWTQYISLKNATHNTSFTYLNKAKIDYTIRALRNLPFGGLLSINIQSISNEPLKIEMINMMDVPDDEYLNKKTQYQFKQFVESHHPKKKIMSVFSCSSMTKNKSHKICASSSFRIMDESAEFELQYDKNEHSQILKTTIQRNQSFSVSLIGIICSTREYKDVCNEAERQVTFACLESIESLINKHNMMWSELWESDIKIEGDSCKEIQKIVRFALYNLYSFGRSGSRLSISPMGLSSQGYNGHIFWDSELWIYPPLLVMNHEISKSLMDYRIDRKEAARRSAYAHGFKGLMYPWESDDNGDESTPTWAFTGPLEHHVTADVGIALFNYYLVTKDLKWLRDEGYDVIKQIAEFLASRVTKIQAENSTEYYYSIEHVVGADEYAENVTDNAFTNGAVIKCLKSAISAATIIGDNEFVEKWTDIQIHLKIWKFENGTTMEYKGYDGRMIKQADVNLLGYPLDISDSEQQKLDLNYYEQRIDPRNGPLMSYSAFVVQYARLLNVDKATELFPKCYQPNMRPPFGVLAETPISNNPYFATGAGGLLQAVIFGFCGLEITENGIIQLDSVLPKGWKKLTITGVGPEKKTFIRTSQV